MATDDPRNPNANPAMAAQAYIPLIGPLTNLTATAAIIYMVIFQFPQMRTDYREDLRSQRTEFTAALDKMTDRDQQIAKLTTAVAELVDQLKRTPHGP